MKAFILVSLLAVFAGQRPVTSMNSPAVLDEDYGFLMLTDGPCVPKTGIELHPRDRVNCDLMTQPRRYHGTWLVAFETSYFTPMGRENCLQTPAVADCIELDGKLLPWPSKWACPRMFEVEFIGRRNVYPRILPSYLLVVDKLISARRLPDPPRKRNEC